MKDRLIDSISGVMRRAGIQTDGSVVLVALSGGADSVCLLLALHEMEFPVAAMHCNFELRGTESDADEAFCRRLCRTQGISISVKHFRTRSYAQRHGISIEMAARELRYEWFRELAAAQDAQAVCVAHHRDDSVETFLLNLLRGSGIHGLTGMKDITYGDSDDAPRRKLPILRPLLHASRLDIEEWLHERGQKWVTDRTNLSPDAAIRNKIRLQLLPLMEELNPRIRETLDETTHRLADVEALMTDAVQDIRAEVEDKQGSLSVPALQLATAAETVLHEILHPKGYTSSQVREIHQGMDGEPGKLWESRDGWRLLRDRGRLLLQDGTQRQHPAAVHHRVLPLEGLFEGPEGLRLLIRRQTIDPEIFEIPRDSNTVCFDLEKLALPLSVRSFREGDRFQPFGMEGTRLLSDFLTDRKLSLFDKERQQVVLSGNDIVWVVGLRPASGYEVEANTRHVMTITCL